MKTLTATLLLTLLASLHLQAQAAPVATAAASSSANASTPCTPPAVVASFLNLSEAQLSDYVPLWTQFDTALQALQEQIVASQAKLDALLSQPNPNPAAITKLLLQIHALEQQVAQATQSYQAQVEALLTDAQKQKLQAVTLASQLQPVVGAFVALRLAPPPSSLPCQNH